MAINSGDLKLGFWVGLGLMAAFTLWAFASGLFGKLRGSVG